MNNFFNRLSLSQQFLTVSFPVLLAGTLVIGRWIGQQVQDGVVHRIGSETALIVDSLLAPQVRILLQGETLNLEEQNAIASGLANTSLGKSVVSLKIWRRDGYILYSTEKNIIGQTLPIDGGLAAAFSGNIFSEVSERNPEQQLQHAQPLPRLIETYIPIHEVRTGRVIAAAELYQMPDQVDLNVTAAKWRSWLLVAGTTGMMYLLLFVLVRRGSKTITRQQAELSDKVSQLTAVNSENTTLRERVIEAADRATAMNETFLQRVSSNIHDGPGQDLGYALMQLKNMADTSAADPAQPSWPWLKNIEPTRAAVQSALSDLRAISSNLDLPDLADLDPGAVAARAVRDFQHKTGARVELDLQISPQPAAFRSKVALYRLLQEALANALRHAKCDRCRVILRGHADHMEVEITDGGPGFNLAEAAQKGRLGLQSMRQRIEVLGGTFEITSQTESGKDRGTQIRATLPLATFGNPHD